MKHKLTGWVVLVFIYGVLFSGFGWVIKGKARPAKKLRHNIIDSVKVDSITIKIYKDETIY